MVEWKDLPVEIQNLMLDEQEKQGNPRNKEVFINRIQADRGGLGFNWDKSTQGSNFWIAIISEGNLKPYYERCEESTKITKEDSPKEALGNFYIKCNSDEESQLCEKWAKDNKLKNYNFLLFCKGSWDCFIVKGGRYYINNKLGECSHLKELQLSDLGISLYKETTKEAYETQEKPKTIEKWSVGSYIVFLKELNGFKKGFVDLIVGGFSEGCVTARKYLFIDTNREAYNEIKWFATKSEAEEFAKTLVEPVKEEAKEEVKKPKFKVGDAIKSNPVGWQYLEGAIDDLYAIGCLPSNVNLMSGKCTRVEYSETNKRYWYKIDDYGNMFTEDCITLVDSESKEAIPEYVKIKDGKESYNYNNWLGAKDRVNNHYNRKYKILKVVDWNYNSTDLIYLLIDPDGTYTSFMAKACDASSKEEYELQDKPKQPLKQAVHCKTQEEWDFMTKKLGYIWFDCSRWENYRENTCISLNSASYGTSDIELKDYQILSFQEWCDLNGYKMEKEVKFEVGKWYKNPKWSSDKDFIKCSEELPEDGQIHGSECIFLNEWESEDSSWSFIETCVLASIEEIQPYLPDNHPDKIQTKADPKPEFNYKFKIGDVVRIVKSGYGYSNECIEEEVEILELGNYLGHPGYRTSRTNWGNSNANDGECNYMAGEDSFELVEEEKHITSKAANEYITLCDVESYSWINLESPSLRKYKVTEQQVIKQSVGGIKFEYLPEPE